MSAATTYERNEPSFIPNEEAALLASARAGDSAAFECLVMPHWDALQRVTQRILRNREDAEDAVSDRTSRCLPQSEWIPRAFAFLLVAHSHRHECGFDAPARESTKKRNIA